MSEKQINRQIIKLSRVELHTVFSRRIFPSAKKIKDLAGRRGLLFRALFYYTADIVKDIAYRPCGFSCFFS